MNNFQWTKTQSDALELVKQNKFILLFGGSRSGKTFVLTAKVVARALKEPKSRHVIFRQHRKDLKESVWLDTFVKVLDLLFPNAIVQKNEAELFAKFSNGSEIWFSYLDDSKNADAVLGKEYNTIYLNEVSEISYKSFEKAQTRLSLKNGLKNRMYCDCNPVGRWHWSYKLFIEKVNPKTKDKLTNGEKFASMLMNPQDNIANLPEDYLETLQNLSEDERNRFLLGIWSEGISGGIYTKEMGLAEQEDRITDVPFDNNYFVYTFWDLGMDDSTAIWFVQFIGDKIHLIDFYQNNNQSALHYLDVLRDKTRVYGYRYARLILPHDAHVREWTNGRSRSEIIEEQGFKTEVVKATSIVDGINACKVIFNRCYFDKVKCEEGISALANYRRKEDAINMTFSKEPLHDWTSHASDSFRLMGVSYTQRMNERVDAQSQKSKFERSLEYANTHSSYRRTNQTMWG